jgi:hypothetical protein
VAVEEYTGESIGIEKLGNMSGGCMEALSCCRRWPEEPLSKTAPAQSRESFILR